MKKHSQPSNDEEQRQFSAHRFLRKFARYVLVVAVLVASVNLVAFKYMVRDENQAIVQLLSGWGRMYKPILYDKLSPDVVVLGSSWARDAFDPIKTGHLLGKTVFNHAVSGGTVYETRRFADSSLNNPNLKFAIVNLDTIYRDKDARTKYGFDEFILNVHPDHSQNRWVGVTRAYSLALTGWAIGTNIELVSAILARDSGAAASAYLSSYQKANMTSRRPELEAARQRLFPPNSNVPQQTVVQSLSPFQELALLEFDVMIGGFCEHGVDMYAYFTPRHVWEKSCDREVPFELVTLEYLRRKQPMCDANIKYFNFDYPNAVTLEGVLSAVTDSRYYRPDGHPRPTVGLLMAASMFGVDFPPATPSVVKRDFGVDLLAHPDAEGWLLERAVRCQGEWTTPAPLTAD